MRELVLLGLGVFVFLIWGIAVMVQVIAPQHVVPNQVHAIALVVAGSFFAGGAVAGLKKGNNGGT